MISGEDQALVEDTIRGFPSRELVRSRSKNWTTEHVDYALARTQQFTDISQQYRVEALLLEIRAEIQRAEAERLATVRQAATETALADLRRAIEKGPKAHWSQAPGFWVAVVAAIAALVAAWPIVHGWLE
jgi:hypothetical protein